MRMGKPEKTWKSLPVLMMLLVLAPFTAAQQPETLANALKRESIPVAASIPNLNARITSYAILNDDREFLIAYYLLEQDNALHAPLYLTRFQKKARRWQHKSLTGVKLGFFEESQQKSQVDCLGSVLSIQRDHARYYLNLDLTPSAGCLLVLSQDLNVWQTLAGWPQVFFPSGLLVLSGDMVHFACVHPERLFLYDPVGRKIEQIYPQQNDRLRDGFSSRLEKIINLQRCATNNCACDPKEFTSVVSSVVVNDQTQALAFRADFEPEGFLSREEAEDGNWNDDHYAYIYQLHPRRWRAFSIYDLKAKFGTESLQDLLVPSKLEQGFAVTP